MRHKQALGALADLPRHDLFANMLVRASVWVHVIEKRGDLRRGVRWKRGVARRAERRERGTMVGGPVQIPVLAIYLAPCGRQVTLSQRK